MTNTIPNLLDFYAQPGMMTDPGQNADLLDGLPTDIPALCQVVQQNLLHVFWAERYGRVLSDADKQPLNIRPVSRKLALMRQVDARPLTAPRPLENAPGGQLPGFLAAADRHPAPSRPPGAGALRVRRLFHPGSLRRSLGVRNLERRTEALGVWWTPNWTTSNRGCSNPLSLRWMCRVTSSSSPGRPGRCAAKAARAPEQFGIFDMNGWWFIWGNVVRDFLGLNKVEILPWDYEIGSEGASSSPTAWKTPSRKTRLRSPSMTGLLP